MTSSIDKCAQEVLEVVPLIMRAIRAEMRRHRGFDLSVPQFRAMAFLKHYEGASLSDAAEFVGLTLPSMSKLVDGLVTRQLVKREISPSDRRYVTLALTELGQATLQSAYEATQAYLAQRLAGLSTQERTTVEQAMHVLRPLFIQANRRSMNGVKEETTRVEFEK
jgi:DNA-binding MarR family transcriptional regulator